MPPLSSAPFRVLGVALSEGSVQLLDPAVVAPCDGQPLPVGEHVRVRLVEADLDTRRVRFTWDG